MSDSRIGPFVEANKARHGFLWFAGAVEAHKGDASQSRMLAKLYGFLYDFLPGGFTGRWSHIRGNDVMEILLCQRKDMAVSRHKATNNVQASFDYLEKWMKKGADWRDALRKDADQAKKKGPKKTLTQYSPENLVALLVLSYPDPKYRQWVGRLQIGWMMEEEVQVRDGFWKGLTRDDIALIFQPNDPRPSELPLAADYDALFGSDFVSARENIRPFLPAWAAELDMPVDKVPRDGAPEGGGAEDQDAMGDPGGPDHAAPSASEPGDGKEDAVVVDLRESPDGDRSDSDELSDLDSADAIDPNDPDTAVGKPPNGTEVNGSGVADLGQLGELLADGRAATGPPDGDLLEWLVDRMSASGSQDVLPSWCERWAARMDEAAYYEDQMIVRSLFLRSIRTLHHLERAPTRHSAFTDAFMLLDIEDGRTRTLPSDEEGNKSIERVRRLPNTKPLVDAEEELARLARDDAGRDLLDGIFREQLAFVLELFTNELFNSHLQNVISLEAAQMKLAADASQSKALPQPLDGLAARMDKSLISSLGLSKWQVRALAVSKSGADLILTDWQARVYRQHYGTPGALGANRYRRVQPDEAAVDRDIDLHIQATTRRLFGDLEQPFIAAHGDVWDACRMHDQQDHASRHKPSSSATPSLPQGGSRPPETPARQVAQEPPPFNPFTSLLGKRACSTDLRKAKIPRLASGRTQDSVEELRTDVSAGNERLRDDLKAVILSARDEVLGCAETKSSHVCARVDKRAVKTKEQVEAKIQSSMDVLEARMADQIRSVKDDLESRMAKDTRDLQASIQSALVSLTAAIDKGVAEHGQQLDVKTRAVTDILHDLGEKSATHNQARAQTSSLPGQDGYLAANCPAPAGWDQDSYDGALLRAGWHYITCFEIPDDGVLADPHVFETTAGRFPGLDRQHLAMALEHAHHQAYHRPVLRDD